MSVPAQIAFAWAACAAAFAVLWQVQRTRGDAGIVDVAWSLGVGACGAAFAALGSGDPVRRSAVGAVVSLWGLRLAWHVVQRLRRLPEDGRYVALKRAWGPDSQRRMFFFYQFQALASVLFALPVLLASSNGQPWSALDFAGLAIWGTAISGETIADRQLARFRADPANRGRVCRTGLWSWSRHPNYFFEWLHWWAYAAFAWGAPWGGLAVLGPAAMLFVLLRVTGIPPTEAQALASRGEAYREYQRTTSRFVPWPPGWTKRKEQTT